MLQFAPEMPQTLRSRPIRRLLLLSVPSFIALYGLMSVLKEQRFNDQFNDDQWPQQLGRGLLNLEDAKNTNLDSATAGNEEVFSMWPIVDKSHDQDSGEVLASLEKNLPNLPSIYLHDNKALSAYLVRKGKEDKLRKGKNLTEKCEARFPALYDLHFNNLYWQTAETSDGTLYLYAAYYDSRDILRGKKREKSRNLRILAMMDRIQPTVSTHCQLWFELEQKEAIFAKVQEYKYIWLKQWGSQKAGVLQPYLLTCALPENEIRVPTAVSIVEKECGPITNNLRVVHQQREERSQKPRLGVCVKGLDFPHSDISVRLIEWLEVLRSLGVNRVFLYHLSTHPNVSKVIDHYHNEGFVELTHMSLPGHQPNLEGLQHLYLRSKLGYKRLNEVIPYNDCLYRNLYEFDYLALLDIDEVIVPLQHLSWQDMMEMLGGKQRSAFCFRNVYFMDEMSEAHLGTDADLEATRIPLYMHIMRHVYRSANYTKLGQYVKCLHNTQTVQLVHNHFPLVCLGSKKCSTENVAEDVGHLQHYRADCVRTLSKSCDKDYKRVSVRDTNIWRFRDNVVKRTTDVLKKLNFLQKTDMIK